MNSEYSSMRSNVNMLGTLLGDAIKRAAGNDTFDLVEQIRQLSKSAQQGNKQAHNKLLKLIENLNDEDLLHVARAFNQFLNLVNTAAEYYGISPHGEASSSPKKMTELFSTLKNLNFSNQTITQAINDLSIELVLTAHPTEINRRTMINTYTAINNCLSQLDHDDLADYEIERIMRRLKQLVCQAWYTDEIRKKRPTPLDEAKWGFSVIEDSLWEGVPLFLREFNDQLVDAFNEQLSVEHVPIKFTSWMGGDRDGNPNVTAKVTEKVMLQARLKAIELFLADIQILVRELSMTECSQSVINLLDENNKTATEPYRAVMKQLRARLVKTHSFIVSLLNNEQVLPPADILIKNEQLWMPLYTCYESLIENGMSTIAHGPLLDTLRRIKSFGLQLVRLDIRQDSSVHTEALDALTKELNLGSYAEWSEEEKQAFLLTELQSNRPLLPYHWQPNEMVQEVLDTCRVIKKAGEESIASYVISMAKAPSDILAVYLLLKIVDCQKIIPVAPLFETLDDLNNAKTVMQKLLDIPWYREKIHGKQMVMIGYSDSAKDAGTLAASWAQYRSQEELVKLFEKYNINLVLFHGRGGSIGRGGAPAHAALLSQPPGSLKGGLRVTEQGEMIRFKLGLPEVALSSLMLYASAILQANLLPPPEPKQNWRDIMDEMSDISCRCYRSYIRERSEFVDYFRAVTPEAELGRLPLGSRPQKRRTGGGIESLRAIPWIFAWTQNRLMVPSWLGAGTALKQIIEEGNKNLLKDMYHNWPFFNARLGMLEMVYAKAAPNIHEYYEQRLVDPALWPLGEELRNLLTQDINTVLTITDDISLMADLPWIAESVALRNTYIEPLNLLQAELLSRSRNRNEDENSNVEQGLMITISGIAAGMRNSG
ncbi:phosphoenolpyruvate carboxylase [Gilliamella sp. B14448G11]|uniref:phosphoenolpyruvate carboxylase n=1 Tax=unclassified Gilliamella TaxID=2685620 RepID=UPI0018DE11FF|nr:MULTISPECIES: phosphoenolpyruvate carboxylase [unclassified Gilliamella]MBI0029242.1 phosphoenolpyruvate carboxylase [Gilliamella sp. B14448G7]MBI0036229.1 phosphoenolpyruvate carboxylase [Gilliamella sp. B14448G11]MBI0043436.1 phosphoenolpyruvate carboxylase [Gilliamella sp. B14448G12]